MSTSLQLVIGLAGIFMGLLVLLSTVGVLTTERRQVGRSLSAIRTIESLPPSMRAEAEPDFKSRVLHPMFGRFTGIGRRFTPTGQVSRLQHKLDVAGSPAGWDVDRILAFKVIGLLGAGVLALLLTISLGSSPLTVIVVTILSALFGYYIPEITLYQLGAKRTERMQKALPDALDMLTISVEAGLAFDAALAQVARNTTGDLANEFFRVLQEMQIGLGRAEALRALGERSTLPELRSFVTAMVQADTFGVPIADVLRVQAGEMRIKRSQRAEEQAQKVPVKILFPLIFCIMPALFIVVIGPAAISIFHNIANR